MLHICRKKKLVKQLTMVKLMFNSSELSSHGEHAKNAQLPTYNQECASWYRNSQQTTFKWITEFSQTIILLHFMNDLI